MERIEELYEKYLNGTITKIEKQQLFDKIDKAQEEKLRQLADKYLNTKTPEDLSHLEEPTEQLLQRINQYISDRDERKPRRLWLHIAAAASILLILAFTIYQYSNRNFKDTPQIVKVVKDLAPGSKRATLTLSDGRTIVLDTAFAGQLAFIDGVRISKTAEGQLIYENNAEGMGTVQTNTVDIPRGGEYQLFLPDGTKVWLNASTIITYPTRFTGTQRKVRIKGEAYLEVAKDPRHPFIVETATENIQVLGTHFNINTYNADRTVTTLEEGSVKVSSLRGTKQSVILKPGQQSINTNTLKVEPADLESALAWKNGLLFFKDAPLTSVLEEVARWYDLEIEYRTKPTEELFSGSVSRTSNLSSMLKILKITGVKTSLVTEGKTHKLIID